MFYFSNKDFFEKYNCNSTGDEKFQDQIYNEFSRQIFRNIFVIIKNSIFYVIKHALRHFCFSCFIFNIVNLHKMILYELFIMNKQKALKLFTSYVLVGLITVSCSKEETFEIPQRGKKENTAHELTSEQRLRAEINNKTATLLSKLVQQPEVRDEIYETIKAIAQKHKWRDEAVYFKEILPNSWNSVLNKPSPLASALKKELNLVSGKIHNEKTQSFIEQLIDNDIEFYFPYHEDFHNPKSFAVTFQDGINEYEKEGYSIIDGEEKVVLVNDEYAMNHPTLIVGQFNNNRVAPENESSIKSARAATDPIWINWGYVKAEEMHEGLLKGGPEFRFTSTDATILGNNATAFPTNEVHVNMSRKDVSDKRAKYQYIVLDQFWDLFEVNKTIHVYEDDRDGVMGAIKNILLPVQIQIPGIGVVSINAGKQISTKDEDLGYVQYNRLMFYASYHKNVSTYGHGLTPDNWPWLKHGSGIFYSLPRLFN